MWSFAGKYTYSDGARMPTPAASSRSDQPVSPFSLVRDQAVARISLRVA